MTRHLSRLFLLAALAMAALCLHSLLRRADHSLAFIIADPERDLDGVLVGASPLTFEITNRSGVPRRVIGLAEG